MEGKFCSKCGTQLKSEDRFCPECGSKIFEDNKFMSEQIKVPPPPIEKTDYHIQETDPENYYIPPKEFDPFKQNADVKTSAYSNHTIKTRNILFLIIVVLLLLLGIIFVVVLL